jgi:HEAT repeat protein
LKDESAENRAMAVAALARFPRGVSPWLPSVLRMMEHDKPPVRAACEKALARVRPAAISAESVPVLTAALRSPDSRVGAAACSTLMQFGPEARAAIPALLATAREKRDGSVTATPSSPDLRHLAIEALGRIAPQTESAGEVITALIEILRAEDPSTWSTAVYALERFGAVADSVIPELIRVLRKNIAVESPLNCGSSAAMELGQFAPGTRADGPAIAVLTEALEAKSSMTRYGAAFALRKFGPGSTATIPRLRALTKDPDASVRQAASGTLAELATAAKSHEE